MTGILLPLFKLRKTWKSPELDSLTEPEFSSNISKSSPVIVPGAEEIFAAVLAPLEHLKYYHAT